MTIAYLPAGGRPAEPWRNGGGVTSPIAAGTGYRISLATIERDGPFSHFPGLRRIFLPSGPVELTVAGRPRHVGRWQPAEFDGGAPTGCRLLAGPVRALNLITAAPQAAVRVRTGPVILPPGGPLALVVLSGTALVRPHRLAEFDALLAGAGTGVEIESAGPGTSPVLAVIELPTE